MGIETSSYFSDNLNSEKTHIWTALSIGFIFIVIGIPTWWKTTEVYRAPLPYNKISQLNEERKFNLRINLLVNCVEGDSKCHDVEQGFIDGLRKELNNVNLDHISIIYSVGVQKESNYQPVVGSIRLALKTGLQFDVMVSKKRIISCTLPNEKTMQNLSEFVAQTAKLVRHDVVADHKLEQIIASIYKDKSKQNHDKETRNMIRSNPKFELLFSLMCPEPDNHLATWDIETAVQTILMPLLSKLKPVFDFDVGSQVIYYTNILYQPRIKKGSDKAILYRYLTPQQLSIIINPIESRLASHVSADPTLNFVVYVTEQKFVPLYIQKEDGDLSKSNAFLVPQWGGMMFYNFFNTSGEMSKVTRAEIDTELVMNTFFPQLRELLGIKMPTSHIHKFEEPGCDGIADWELDYMFRLRTLENIATASQTLNSLSNLLNRISNIVINDNIATHVYKAVESITMAKKHLKSGDLLQALLLSKEGLTASETAFFDPTLLELLYFPEDQKFAIYIPLFLPISIPILVSLYHGIKRLVKKDSAESLTKVKDD